MVLIRNSLVYLKVAESLLYQSKPLIKLASLFGGTQWLAFNLVNVKSYQLKKRWFLVHFLEFSIEEFGVVNHYSLPLPGLSNSQLRELINAINEYTA